MRIALPRTEAAWERLASGIVRAHAGMALVGTNDLVAALARIGVAQSAGAISHKLAAGRFSADFLLQCLVAVGADELELRLKPEDQLLPAVAGGAVQGVLHAFPRQTVTACGKDWKNIASKVVDERMEAVGLGPTAMVQLLHRIGVKTDRRSLAAKLKRDGFAATLLLQILIALDVRSLPLPRIGAPVPPDEA